ncbi:hypothetical protein [Photobacterium leiognathi]|uniref:hypothetical protein n=1 Tax=Photobacterium leiognathi TaxID=553611 RepID=UPI0029823A5D|nr:hypothetical protein [Photobacterium leiognathi]
MDQAIKKNINSYYILVVIWFGLTLSTGALKFFIFNLFPNVFVGGMGFFLILLLHKEITINKKHLFLIFGIFVFFILYYVSFFYNYSDTNLSYILKILSLFINSVSAVFLSTYIIRFERNYLFYVFSSIGFVFSCMYILGFIKPSGAGELSYLNLALPVGIGIISSFILLINEKSRYLKLLCASLFLISLFAIIHLSARMVLISVLFFTLFFLFRYISFIKSLMIVLFSSTVSFVFFSKYFSNSEFLIFKFTRLFENYKDEPRYQVYINSIEYIVNNIGGYGLQSYYKLIGYYPHNLFIEVLMTSGLYCLIILFIFMIITFYYIFKDKSDINDKKFFSVVFVYFLIQWSFSYDFSSSYTVLIPMFTVISINYLRVDNE